MSCEYRWFVSDDRAEKALAAAARLARFNWRRPVEAFAAGEASLIAVV